MKKCYKYIVMFIVLGTNVFAQNCKATLNITANNSSALIFINDNYLGKGSISIEVEKGRYTVAVRESLVKWNGYEKFDTVNVDRCDKQYSLKFDVAEKVFVDSSPQNAAIVENDSIVGYTPNFINLKQFQDIQLKKGSSITDIRYNSLLENKTQHIDYKPKIVTPDFTETPWFKVLVGSAVVFGVTAAYFKLQADKKYDSYLFSKDRSTLDEVDRLDVYSGVALGLLQVNVGYLIYRFLTD